MSGAPGPGPGPGRSPLPCAPRPAAVLQLGGGAEPARPGVAVIDLRFPRGAAADVQEIVFRNFYTAFLSVRVQRPGPAGSRRWVTCLRDYCLMPCPHTEEGSQDYFSLRRHQSPQKDFPSWLSQLTPPEQPASLHGELPDPEKVSTEVQQMWVLTEVIRARQAAARIGRFDVDGCYDINLLSYT
ncbi:nicolin-1 isoform X4 [Chroicocephalus ridibundus]|uniref:nicolin-1 isoform X4 n=1 Tax=Chroicocephalus ridibundus TaxID=1192867 RepID=UPI002FDEF4D0